MDEENCRRIDDRLRKQSLVAVNTCDVPVCPCLGDSTKLGYR